MIKNLQDSNRKTILKNNKKKTFKKQLIIDATCSLCTRKLYRERVHVGRYNNDVQRLDAQQKKITSLWRKKNPKKKIKLQSRKGRTASLKTNNTQSL